MLRREEKQAPDQRFAGKTLALFCQSISKEEITEYLKCSFTAKFFSLL